MGMGVDFAGDTVGSPTGVGDATMDVGYLVYIELRRSYKKKTQAGKSSSKVKTFL